MRNIIRLGDTPPASLPVPSHLISQLLPVLAPLSQPALRLPCLLTQPPSSPRLRAHSHTPPFILPYRVAVLDKVTDFLFLLGKLLIVGSVGEWCHRACPYWPAGALWE